jgi:hypothetical protein
MALMGERKEVQVTKETGKGGAVHQRDGGETTRYEWIRKERRLG